jgi:hypothetical protein
MPIAIPIFCIDPPRGAGGKALKPDARVARGESGDFRSTASQWEVQAVADPFGAWSETSGSPAISELAGTGDSSSPAGICIPSGAATATAGEKSTALVSCIGVPLFPAGAASTAAASAGASIAWPHCLQNRLPGARTVPHITQDRAADLGITAASGCAGAATMGMA